MQSFLSLFSVPDTALARPSDPARATPAPQRIEQAFANASAATGLPFDFFMTTAMRESSLDVNAAATTSSARGPFQFIEQTWLGMVHEHGEALGLAEEAAAIERRSDGRFLVDNPQTREAVLAMRHDPQLSAVMSGLYLQENAGDLQNALGRPVTVGEGYVAHVFGPSGASRLISLAEQQPNRVAADVFPTQAAANRGLFYDRSGEPVSVRQLYDRLVDGFPTDTVSTDTRLAGTSLTARPETVAAPVPRDPSQPVVLEPAGFDALPEAAPPDQFAQMGLFSPAGRGSVPFFAALYRPDGVQAPEIAEDLVATHDSPSPGMEGQQPFGDQRAPVVPNPVSRPQEVGPPLDLVGFVQSGQLTQTYRNPAAIRAGSELVPPV
ncbi:MAG: hypothetical protein JJ908_06025 [Rhizobiales bacterium]|nr:hypothetical protein [Hyphomicrobiales bacterium]MBO6697839.1 hypothetical protein [Hyphomicrobiales bacterium]MBO6735906.1 hypothetical protein [Hyphomicrobiales bacterium]MBO6912376.1 hypothetical protein [Hyphomicrobiales bacterium]MBO6955006.1 hypothetical protein [Hyphomicrobiales bacterium]